MEKNEQMEMMKKFIKEKKEKSQANSSNLRAPKGIGKANSKANARGEKNTNGGGMFDK